MSELSALGLSDWLVKQCRQLGISRATPVQENCMPAILQGESRLRAGAQPLLTNEPLLFVLPYYQLSTDLQQRLLKREKLLLELPWKTL